MSVPVRLVVLTLVAYRVTRLVTLDTLFDRQREWWYNRWPYDDERGRIRVYYDARGRRAWAEVRDSKGSHKLGQLVHCPWCVGFWITGALVLGVRPWLDVPAPALTWWAVACAVGLLGRLDT